MNFESQRNVKKELRIYVEDFPDTDDVVFDAATVDGEEEVEEIEELVKGNESMEND